MTKINKVVGIGASAGGLRAISEFFDHISHDTGMSFIVVQHLSQDFKSMMDELLQRHTKMPIHIVDKPISIEANTIYLISSLHNVILENKKLIPIKRSDPEALNLPIDLFFHSLGKEMKEKTVGIILSGTGSDGSKGVQTIKSFGGIVLVEDPLHAQFDGMPNAAIAATAVNFTLPPYALARELMRLNSGSEKNTTFLIIDPNKDDFKPLFESILEEIKLNTGMNFKNYRHSTLIRRMEKRMFITKQNSLESYLKYIERDEQEVHILKDEFLINVTHFFRDLPAFNLLKANVIPNIISAKGPKDQIRIWTPACSSGQEPISIAIQFCEYLESNNLTNPIKIFASDVDEKVIAAANAGIYKNSDLTDMPREYVKKYFEACDKDCSKYQLTKSLRERIVYAVHDALYDPPFINLDLISCRNMMIYLNMKNQQILLNNFQFALKFEGYMFLGPSESLGTFKDDFLPISNKWNIFQSISNEKALQVNFSTRDPSEIKNKEKSWRNSFPTKAKGNQQPSQLANDKIYTKVLIEEYAPSCILVNENLDVLLTNGDVDRILSFPRVSGHFNLKEMVPQDELIVFKNGVRKCQETKKVNLYENISFRKKKQKFQLTIQFCAIEMYEYSMDDIFIIEFLESNIATVGNQKPKEIISEDIFKLEKISTIEKELRKAQHEKRLLVEQLEMANEELQATNEELLAANEELQSTNEELQSVNEELYTVNTELQSKVNQLISTTNDLDNLLNSTEIGTIFLDQELNIRRFTPAITEQFDLLEGDIGRSITSFTNSLVDKKIYHEIKKVVNQLVVFEKELIDEKGNHYLLRVLPYRAEAGRIDGAVLTFIPINEIKKAHYKLEEVAQRYQAVFDNSSDRILLLNKDGEITSSNASFGPYDKDKVMGTSIFSLMPKPYEQVLNSSIEQVLNGDASSFFHFENKDDLGQKEWHSATVTPVIIQDEIRHLALITRDITEVKLKELELRELGISLEQQVIVRSEELAASNSELRDINSYLDSFVHGAAHDLRAPITQIQGMMQLYPKIKKASQRTEMFEEISGCVSRLEKTLTGLIQMIDFQKNDSRVAQKIKLTDIADDVIDQLQYDINKYDADIAISIPEELKINFVKAYLTSIFYNLLSNGIKYRSFERKLEISVSAKQESEFTVLTFSDNGIGIDLERYGHFLFKPFKRLTLEREGVGIGLSIIKNVVEKNGGRIEVESVLRKGTTFTVYLKSMYRE